MMKSSCFLLILFLFKLLRSCIWMAAKLQEFIPYRWMTDSWHFKSNTVCGKSSTKSTLNVTAVTLVIFNVFWIMLKLRKYSLWWSATMVCRSRKFLEGTLIFCVTALSQIVDTDFKWKISKFFISNYGCFIGQINIFNDSNLANQSFPKAFTKWFNLRLDM